MTTIANLRRALEHSWHADTAFDASEWSPENPARGHCVVSSLIVQDYLGGELLRYAVGGEGIDETHYMNQLDDGTIIDVTASQYIESATMAIRPSPTGELENLREKRLADSDTHNRYDILRQRVEKWLQNNS